MMFLQIPDSMQHDTGYKVGYYIGSWLPFFFLLILTLVVVIIILRQRR